MLGVLLLLGLFFWARRLLGAAGGWLVLVLAAFDPNLLANSRIISTDLPLTALFVLAAWRLWCWLEDGRWYDLLLAGMLGGLTMAAKYNGLLFWPVAGLAALLYLPPADGLRIATRSWWQRLLGVVGAGLIGLIMLWGVYRFTVGVPRGLPLPFPIPAPFFWDNLWATFGGLVQETVVKPDFLWASVDRRVVVLLPGRHRRQDPAPLVDPAGGRPCCTGAQAPVAAAGHAVAPGARFCRHGSDRRPHHRLPPYAAGGALCDSAGGQRGGLVVGWRTKP